MRYDVLLQREPILLSGCSYYTCLGRPHRFTHPHTQPSSALLSFTMHQSTGRSILSHPMCLCSIIRQVVLLLLGCNISPVTHSCRSGEDAAGWMSCQSLKQSLHSVSSKQQWKDRPPKGFLKVRTCLRSLAVIWASVNDLISQTPARV